MIAIIRAFFRQYYYLFCVRVLLECSPASPKPGIICLLFESNPGFGETGLHLYPPYDLKPDLQASRATRRG